MKKLIILVALLSNYINAQSNDAFGVKVTGFIKTDIILDSRQTISAREGHFLLYPANENLDVKGNDLNNVTTFNTLAIQSRVTAKINAPDALGAKTGGMLEGEFFGTTDGDINGFRLRHAFITLKWNATTLLVGQTWHPMFITDVFPQVVSFNTGAPFQPFSRNPQIRITHSIDNFNFIAALCSQRDVTSTGPIGYSTSYLKNAILPNAHFQLQYNSTNLIAGSGIDYKRLVPRTETVKKIKTDEGVSSYSYIGYLKIKTESADFLIEGVYGGNNTDLMMLGGYGVTNTDLNTGIENYSATKAFSVWTDINFGKDIQPGIFIGYSKNLGSDDEIKGAIYSRAGNIDNLFRISPRIVFNSGKFRVAAEFEVTSAAYGATENYAKVVNTKTVTNYRGLMGVYLFF
jgi:hypothetical protein